MADGCSGERILDNSRSGGKGSNNISQLDTYLVYPELQTGYLETATCDTRELTTEKKTEAGEKSHDGEFINRMPNSAPFPLLPT